MSYLLPLATSQIADCSPRPDEVESLKKYSAVIEALATSGAEGVAGKAADLSDGTAASARRTVVIKGDPTKKGAALGALPYVAEFEGTKLLAGL